MIQYIFWPPPPSESTKHSKTDKFENLRKKIIKQQDKKKPHKSSNRSYQTSHTDTRRRQEEWDMDVDPAGADLDMDDEMGGEYTDNWGLGDFFRVFISLNPNSHSNLYLFQKANISLQTQAGTKKQKSQTKL